MEFRGRRAAAAPTIESVRELGREEVANVKLASEPAVKRLRDSHHMVARMVALGVRPVKRISQRTGYTESRISVLMGDPAFQNLVAEYRKTVDDEYSEAVDDYFETMAANRTLSAQLINDKLNAIDDIDDISIRELVAVHSDSADRTGYPKRNVSMNINVDFASRLDSAIKRSASVRTIEASPSSALPSAGEGQRVVAQSPSSSALPALSKMRRLA